MYTIQIKNFEWLQHAYLIYMMDNKISNVSQEGGLPPPEPAAHQKSDPVSLSNAPLSPLSRHLSRGSETYGE